MINKKKHPFFSTFKDKRYFGKSMVKSNTSFFNLFCPMVVPSERILRWT